MEQSVKTAGVGITGAGGVGPVWIAVDANMSWTKPELLDNPVKVSTMGLRFGHNFVHATKPYRNIGIWAGAMLVKMGTETIGQIKLNEAIPQETWDRKDEIYGNYETWYNSLGPAEKIVVDQTPFPAIMEAFNDVDGEATIKYGIDKSVKQPWNGLVGGQYQHNKNWMLRSEVGFIGDRKSVLVSLNYRFD